MALTEINFSDLCKFQPKQAEAAKALLNHKFLLYGGAMFGGKSYWLRWTAVELAMYYAARYGVKGGRIGLFCEDYPALNDRQLSKIPYEFPSWLGKLNLGLHEYKLADRYGGWTIAFRNLDDPSKYSSAEFAAILVDELTKNPREMFDFLAGTRMRWPGVEDVHFAGATNPGGVGHAWVKKLWIDRDFTGETLDPKEFCFISAQAKDNKFLTASYLKQLETLPEKLRKAYLDGDWDIFAGQFFTEWNSTKHVIPEQEIPSGWSRIRCLDYGFQAPSACYWLAIDYDGNIYVYRELYEAGLTYSALAKRIKLMTPDSEQIEYTVADTSMFAKTLDTGEYGQDIFANEGVPLTPANKERIASLNLVREYLKRGSLKFFRTCKNAIRTIPALVHSEVKPEDIDSKCEDHAIDAIRYGLMSLPPLPVREHETIKNPYENDKSSPWGKPDITDDYYSYR